MYGIVQISIPQSTLYERTKVVRRPFFKQVRHHVQPQIFGALILFKVEEIVTSVSGLRHDIA